MEEGRLDRRRVEPELGQDLGGRDRVDDVRIARGALLALVGGDREVEGAPDGFEIRARVLREDGRVEPRPESRRGRDPCRAGREAVTGARRGPRREDVGGGGLGAWCRACHRAQGYAQP